MTLKSYGRECLVDPNKFHYLVCGCIEFDCGRTYVRTYVRTDGRTLLPGLLGHLGGDDLIKRLIIDVQKIKTFKGLRVFPKKIHQV